MLMLCKRRRGRKTQKKRREKGKGNDTKAVKRIKGAKGESNRNLSK